MRQRAHGPEGSGGPGSPPRLAAGSARGPVQQTQAGRGPVLDAAQLEVLRRYGGEHDVAAGDVLFADGDVSYDLIVVSEVLYYLSAPDLASSVDGLVARLEDEGDLVAVHHRAADRCYGYDGFNVHAVLAARPELREIVSYDDADFALRVFRKHAPPGFTQGDLEPGGGRGDS